MIKVIIYRDYGTLNLKILVIEETYNKRFVLNLYTQERYELDEFGVDIPEEYIMKVPYSIKDIFLKAFAEEVNKYGIKTDMDAKFEGKLEATKYHLEDLRKLLKLK